MAKNSTMNNLNKVQTRKKFIGAGITAAAFLTAFRFIMPEKNTPKANTVRMLTQDGKLVEVEVEEKNLVSDKRSKITDEELKNWVSKK